MNTPDTDKHLTNTYVSDMVALFEHISTPLESQMEIAKTKNFGDALSLVQSVRTVVSVQRTAFDAHLKALGGSPDHGIKSVWGQILGVGASAINDLRGTKLSKALRDDYTALSLSAVSLTMLHATSVGIGDVTTAALAKGALDSVAPLVIEISRAMPAIVLEELKADGENVSISAADFTEQTTQEAWKNN